MFMQDLQVTIAPLLSTTVTTSTPSTPYTLPRPSHYISFNVHPPPPHTHTPCLHTLSVHLSVMLCIDICITCIKITEALRITFHYGNQYERLLTSCTPQSPSVDLEIDLDIDLPCTVLTSIPRVLLVISLSGRKSSIHFRSYRPAPVISCSVLV